ncbi:MAG: hypothetical protein IJX25_00675 [Clostridia bacterium]|nr:hypothetical protein [Clostridia bacterium]
MKKKFTRLVMCLLVLCLTIFTGCSLVEVDSDKYYNSVVVEIKDENGKVVSQITNRDLINGYQNVGYYYEYYYGYTKAEAVDMTLSLLEERKMVILQAEKIWGIDKTGTNLSDIEKSYIWEQTVSALQDNLNSYLDTKEEEEEEKAETTITYEGFQPTAYLELDGDGNYQIKLVDPEDGVLDNYRPTSYKDYNKEEDRKLIYENFFENNRYGENFTAYKEYLNYLKSSENDKTLASDAKSVFEREIERLYNQSYENYVVEKYSEQLLETNGFSSIEVQDILDLYSSKVRSAYTQYVLEKDSGYDDAMQENTSDVYYYLQGQENTKYFNVLNILFSESTTEEGKYDLIIRDNDGEGNYVEQSNVTATKSEIYAFISDNISTIISNAQNSSDSDILYDAMQECVFKYNQDPGMQSADTSYSIGVDSAGTAISGFVEEFNTAGLNLFNGGKGNLGDIEIVESEYGIHVLVYTGECKNLFAGIDEKFALKEESAQEGQLSAIELLSQTRVDPMLDKTYFDLLYEELYVDNSSNIQQADMDVLRANYTIVYYEGIIPDALKG